ncbi:MAG: Eco29kI family restriction endonuclease [Nitrospirae bacterium]|nr:Eco29kI family restriction endonuclease [Nitrospirota bacterium]
MKEETPYNPLDKLNLGKSVEKALLESPVRPLPPEEKFIGAGIYAIYYVGDYPAYEPVSRLNRDNRFDMPIYVGKAVPEGARKGGFGLGVTPGEVLHKRLSEHAKSIEQVQNLELSDFFCRYLAVDDIWIPLGESLLIEMYSPAWNIIIDGFGNHDPGKGRYNQQKSPWDVLHPGRLWAERLKDNNKSEVQILSGLEAKVGK